MRCKEIYKWTKIDHLALTHFLFSQLRLVANMQLRSKSTFPQGVRGVWWRGGEDDSVPHWKVTGLIPTAAGTSVLGQLARYLLANRTTLWINAENVNVAHGSPRGCDMFPVANIACRDSPTIWTMGPVLKGRWKTLALLYVLSPPATKCNPVLTWYSDLDEIISSGDILQIALLALFSHKCCPAAAHRL